MSNNNGTSSSSRCDQFRCLFCSTSSSGGGIGSSPLEGRGTGNENDKNLYKMVFILHKLLQIPLWECTKYLISSEDGSINSIKLCNICTKMVDEGQSLVEKVERLQLKLQTLQATLQNQLLSGQTAQLINQSPTVLDQSKLRSSIRDEIRNNVCRSSLQSCSFSAFGTGEGQLDEIVQPAEASTPAELGVNAQGQEERVQMTIEVGEVKVETEESFNYEVIDLVDDNDNNEYGNSQLGQDWDDMVSEVTSGGCGTIDRRLSQRQEGPSCSATLSSSIRGTDMSPLSGPPRRKRACSVIEDGSSDASIPTPSPPVPISQQFMLKQQSSQPGTSPQQYHSQTQQSTSVTLLQTLLSTPQNLTLQSPFTSPSSTRGKQVVWSGVLEWNERRIIDGLQYRHPNQVSCRIYAAVVNHIPMVNTAGWPAKLLMQYIPKAFVAAVRPATDLLAKTVLVEFDQPLSPQVQQMTRVLDGGYAGCIRFTGAHPNCVIKLMALIHVRSKGAYVAIIPDQQDEFIRKLQNVIKVYNERQALKQNVQYLQNSVSASNIVNVTQVISNNPQSSVVQQQQPTGATIHHMPSTLSVQTETQQRQENLLRIQQLQQTLERCRELGYQA